MGVILDLGLEVVLLEDRWPKTLHEGYSDNRREDGTWTSDYLYSDRTALRMRCECGWTDSVVFEVDDYDGDQDAAEDAAQDRWSSEHARPWVLREGLPKAWERVQSQAAWIKGSAERLAELTDGQERVREAGRIRQRVERLTEMVETLERVEDDVSDWRG